MYCCVLWCRVQTNSYRTVSIDAVRIPVRVRVRVPIVVPDRVRVCVPVLVRVRVRVCVYVCVFAFVCHFLFIAASIEPLIF